MKKFKYISNENGQILVLFALLLPVIIGFVAFSVDIGWIFYNKAKLQYASDLAVLASGQTPIKGEEYKTDLKTAGIAFDCKTYIDPASMPPPQDTDLLAALYYLCLNYPSDKVEDINFIHAKVSDKLQGIEAHIIDKIPLFFAPVIGIDTATIHARSYMAVGRMKRPAKVIPLALPQKVYDDYKLGIYDPDKPTSCKAPDLTKKEILVWSDDSRSIKKGNFGLIDFSKQTGTTFTGKLLQDLIMCGFPCSNPSYPGTPPAVLKDKIDVKTGSMSKHIADGFNTRLDKNFFMPVVKFDHVSGSSAQVIVEGYVLIQNFTMTSFDSSPTTSGTCVYGTLEPVFRSLAGEFEYKIPDFGTNNVQLMDKETYDNMKKLIY